MIAVINFSGETWKSTSTCHRKTGPAPGLGATFGLLSLQGTVQGHPRPGCAKFVLGWSRTSWENVLRFFFGCFGHLKLRSKRCFVLKFYDFVRFFRRFLWFCHVFPDFRSFQYLCSGLGVWFHSEKTEWISPDRDEPEGFFFCVYLQDHPWN